MDVSACNYDFEATIDDGSCLYAELNYDCDGNCLNDEDLDGVCDEIDNCIDVSNFDQNDEDEDGIGDACDEDYGIGIDELSQDKPKLIKMVDVLGRTRIDNRRGVILIELYDDGSTVKRIF